MLWAHTKTLVPAEAGHEFFVETLKPPLAKHKIAFTTNSVPCTITPPLFVNHKGYIHQMTNNQQPQLRAYPNNPLYCGRLQSPMPALSGQKCSQRGENHVSEHFWPAALASNFSLGLITTRLFG
jgi:hypothetical protein